MYLPGALFKALDFARKCLDECGSKVSDARDHCNDCFHKGTDLVTRCSAIVATLEGASNLNPSSLQALTQLCQGDEIKQAIELGQSMDILVVGCTNSVIEMTDAVSRGYSNLPPIITKGIPNMRNAGRAQDDPAPAAVAADVDELERSHS